MASLLCSLEGKSFQLLLNGLSKKLFYGEDVSIEYLAEQLYTGMELEGAEVRAQIKSYEKLLRVAAFNNWDVSKFEEVLNSSNISPAHFRTALSFWTNEREKIHNSILRGCTWNNKLKQLSWRVDMKAASKNMPEINEPVAMIEFGMDGELNKEESGVVRCELNRTKVGEILGTLEEIQRKIDTLSA
mmetsp:Transcript_19929/g.28648  ORF Transcript_19929/g.28648 Transcript_19929/m.28648 type:complete len:187 (-) Transcript_19929:123-683(-)|eukprot:CAMPEP_0185031314 /NCGR_PEP_ID=MMETSP1103-20130426/18719_1 /TAXON_ID=36769 /ORGANISM="Paraphysomonas bandaiensis, Strain Caron Lab Isolate" /LENGTH=186 /DNA_ID=CAMNT_0027566803 /DNA_START=23 /DNA_END=583 /DNA_ORIENTATION=+